MGCYNFNIRNTKERETALIEREIKFTNEGDYLRVNDPDFEVDDLFDLIEELGSDIATAKHTKPETLYIPIRHATAFKSALDEFAKDGIQNTSIKHKEEGNHLVITIEPTAASYLFDLGMKFYKNIEPVEEGLILR